MITPLKKWIAVVRQNFTSVKKINEVFLLCNKKNVIVYLYQNDNFLKYQLNFFYILNYILQKHVGIQVQHVWLNVDCKMI